MTSSLPFSSSQLPPEQPWLPWKSFRALRIRFLPKTIKGRLSPGREKAQIRASLPLTKTRTQSVEYVGEGRKRLKVRKPCLLINIQKPRMFPMVYRRMDSFVGSSVPGSPPRLSPPKTRCAGTRAHSEIQKAPLPRSKSRKVQLPCDLDISEWSIDGGTPRLSDFP